MSIRGAKFGNYNDPYNNDLRTLSVATNQYPNNTAYVRPSDWPAIPSISAGTEKIYILYAVYPWGSGTYNYASYQCTGAYNVDWGDGTSENVASGVQVNHTYDYANANLSALTTRGYKTALITITPQAGQNLTNVNLCIKPTSPTGLNNLTNNNLEIVANLPNVTVLSLNNSSWPGLLLEKITLQQNNLTSGGGWNNSVFAHARGLKQIVFKDGPTPFAGMGSGSGDQVFVNNNSLRSIEYANTAPITPSLYWVNEFNNNWAWVEAPWMELGTVNNLTNLFLSCRNLVKVPAYDTSNATSMAGMFSSCTSLVEVPNFNTTKVTDISSVFNNCTSLNQVPRWDTANVTTIASAFATCVSLKEVPSTSGNNWNTSKVTTMNGTFAGCLNLLQGPDYDTANVTDMTNMFSACGTIIKTPDYNTANVTLLNTMFSGCTSLQIAPTLDTTKVTSVTGMFTNCINLKSVPAYNLANVTNGGSTMINTATGLVEFLPTNINTSLNLPAANFTANAANIILNNLSIKSAAANVLTMATNPGIDALVSKTSVTCTAGSTTLSIANTVGLSSGMVITGGNVANARACTANVNTITLTAHGLPANAMVSFNLANITGVANTPVYVTNATANTFQVSTTQGGPAITFLSNSTPNVQYGRYISSIVANTSITMTTPAGGSGTGTITFRVFDTTLATLKGWTVSG